MKTHRYIMLLACIYSFALWGQTSSSPIDLGRFTNGFAHSMTHNTNNYLNSNSERPSKEVYYKFAINVLMEVTITHCSSEVTDTYLTLTRPGYSKYTNDDYTGSGACSNTRHAYIKKVLKPGIYIITSEGNGALNGNIRTGISGTPITTLQSSTMDTPINLGTFSGEFTKIDTKNTRRYKNTYTDYPFNTPEDLFYKFTTTKMLDLYVSFEGDGDVRYARCALLSSTGNKITSTFLSYYGNSSLQKTSLSPGTYYVVMQGAAEYGGESNGEITTKIQGIIPSAGERKEIPIELGTFDGAFTQNKTIDTSPFATDYGTIGNDVFYKFTTTQTLDIEVSHCGSVVTDTYAYLLDETGKEIATNNDYTGSKSCANSKHAYIKKEDLPPGTYYVVSEGNGTALSGPAVNGSIATKIQGVIPADGERLGRPAHLGSYAEDFIKSDTKNTALYNNRSTNKAGNDVYYKLELTNPMDLIISNCGSSVTDTHLSLLSEEKEVLYSNDDYTGSGQCANTKHARLNIKTLQSGTYYIVSDGNTNGNIITTVKGTKLPPGDRIQIPIDLGTHDLNFQSTPSTINTSTLYTNAYGGKFTNDVYYKFTLLRAMDITISHCGSSLADTYMTLLNEKGEVVTSNDNYTGEGKCANTGNSVIKIDMLPKGTYYVISEGASLNGLIMTTVKGAALYGGLKSSDKKSYVYTIIPTEETADATKLGTDKSIQTIQYYDAFGRPEQTIQRGITPTMKDLIARQEYDEQGRDAYSWLPGAVDANHGAFNKSITIAIKTTNDNDDKPYSETTYESSAQGRVLTKTGPGADWHNNKKRVELAYLSNEATTSTNKKLVCARYAVVEKTKLKKLTGGFPAGELFVTESKDEDGNLSYEFKDKQGQVLLTRQICDNQHLDTYYVYDNFGNLTFVLPPLAADALANENQVWTEATQQLKDYAYLYRYDYRNRCIWKKLPACEPIYYVYDKADQLIFTQDGEQRKAGEWMFSIPDAFGRMVLNGKCTTVNGAVITSGRFDTSIIRADFSTTGTYMGYNVKVGQTSSAMNTLTIQNPAVYTANYYDNYDYRKLSGFSEGELSYKTVEVQAEYLKRYGTDASRVEHKGLLVGTAVAQLGGAKSESYLYTCMYYDNKKRLIQRRSTHHLGGFDTEYLAYNFSGQLVSKRAGQSLNAPNSFLSYEYYYYTYDHAGRLIKEQHRQDGKETVTLAENTYDELGRLKTNKKGNNANLLSTYDYNVRSWTKSINSPLFSQELHYNTSFVNNVPQYGGNITAMSWKVQGESQARTYSFTYDNLSRLKHSAYNNVASEGNYNTSYNYDKHGNFNKIVRRGRQAVNTYSMLDDIGMRYKGNQLIKATDNGIKTLVGLSDFKEYTHVDFRSDSLIEYTYNANGAMTKDLNKGITKIQYNSLNLPRQMDINAPSAEARTKYIYAATGAKLRVESHWNEDRVLSPISTSNYNKIIGKPIDESHFNRIKTTDYINNKIYENGDLKMILLSGGYYDYSEKRYYYYLTDHLGNNRVVAKSDGTVVQKTHYYPFGMAFAEGTAAEQGKQPYKYNGKELDTQHGLNMYDYSARYYEPAMGRFTSVDPLAEKFYSWSPYVYCYNNPIRFIDPDGKRGRPARAARDLTRNYNQMRYGRGNPRYAAAYPNGIRPASTITTVRYSMIPGANLQRQPLPESPIRTVSTILGNNFQISRGNTAGERIGKALESLDFIKNVTKEFLTLHTENGTKTETSYKFEFTTSVHEGFFNAKQSEYEKNYSKREGELQKERNLNYTEITDQIISEIGLSPKVQVIFFYETNPQKVKIEESKTKNLLSIRQN